MHANGCGTLIASPTRLDRTQALPHSRQSASVGVSCRNGCAHICEQPSSSPWMSAASWSWGWYPTTPACCRSTQISHSRGDYDWALVTRAMRGWAPTCDMHADWNLCRVKVHEIRDQGVCQVIHAGVLLLRVARACIDSTRRASCIDRASFATGMCGRACTLGPLLLAPTVC